VHFGGKFTLFSKFLTWELWIKNLNEFLPRALGQGPKGAWKGLFSPRLNGFFLSCGREWAPNFFLGPPKKKKKPLVYFSKKKKKKKKLAF